VGTVVVTAWCGVGESLNLNARYNTGATVAFYAEAGAAFCGLFRPIF
jgi:hypothetical protein